MSSLQYQKAFRKQQKTKYKGLTPEQKQYIKAEEERRITDKGLNDFYAHAPRNNNGAVNWNALTEQQLDYFEQLNRQHNKAVRTMSRLEDGGLDGDYTLKIFMQINTHSMSF